MTPQHNTSVLIDASRMAAIVNGLTRAGSGGISITLTDAGEWLVAAEYGREAPDSPMVGASSYGTGFTAREAIDQVLAETGWRH